MTENWCYTVAIIAATVVICFCSVQIRGCQTDCNVIIAELAKQGVRAQLLPDGKIQIMDTQHWKEKP